MPQTKGKKFKFPKPKSRFHCMNCGEAAYAHYIVEIGKYGWRTKRICPGTIKQEYYNPASNDIVKMR